MKNKLSQVTFGSCRLAWQSWVSTEQRLVAWYPFENGNEHIYFKNVISMHSEKYHPIQTIFSQGVRAYTLPNLSQFKLEFQVEYQTEVGIPSWIRIEIGVPSWIVDLSGECIDSRKYTTVISIHTTQLGSCFYTAYAAPCMCDTSSMVHMLCIHHGVYVL